MRWTARQRGVREREALRTFAKNGWMKAKVEGTTLKDSVRQADEEGTRGNGDAEMSPGSRDPQATCQARNPASRAEGIGLP